MLSRHAIIDRNNLISRKDLSQRLRQKFMSKCFLHSLRLDLSNRLLLLKLYGVFWTLKSFLTVKRFKWSILSSSTELHTKCLGDPGRRETEIKQKSVLQKPLLFTYEGSSCHHHPAYLGVAQLSLGAVGHAGCYFHKGRGWPWLDARWPLEPLCHSFAAGQGRENVM